MDLYLVSVLVFLAALAAIIYRDSRRSRKSWTSWAKIAFIRRSQRGKRLLIRLGTRFPRFWKAVGNFAVVFGIFISVYFIYLLILQLIIIIQQNLTIGAGVVIPSLSQEAVYGTGYLAIPFWHWVISIALLLVVHEGMHGIIAAREKFRIKSLGIAFLTALPIGAFVEPDEKQMAKAKPMKQLRVFAAGSFGNFCLAGLSFLLLILVAMSLSSVTAYTGVGYNSTMEGYPAQAVGMAAPGIITGINGYDINTIADLEAALGEIGPNQMIEVHVSIPEDGEFDNRVYSLTTMCMDNSTSCDTGFIGISTVTQEGHIKAGFELLAGALSYIFSLLYFLFLLNFAIGGINLLPLGPLDGGRMYSIILNKKAPKYASRIMKFLSWFVLMLILLNVIAPFINLLT